MKKRILICEPDPDVRTMLELTVERLGHVAAARESDGVDAVVMEPGCEVERARLLGFAHRVPIVCLSIHPPEDGFAPAGTVAYLMKPAKSARLGAALASALAT